MSIKSQTIKSISIIIPCYNEQKTITILMNKVIQFDSKGLIKEIIIIDDASKDNSTELILKEMNKIDSLITTSEFTVVNNELLVIKLIKNQPNLGKSRTVKKGILESTGDIVVIQDADLEYDPNELTAFVELFLADNSLQVVYGNRFGKNNKVVYWKNWIGNRFLTFVSNIFTGFRGFRVSDMEVCYKMVKGDLMRTIGMSLVSISGFGFEPEITAKLSKVNPKYAQVAISYSPRTLEEGKHMSAYKDGVKALWEILRFNLIPFDVQKVSPKMHRGLNSPSNSQ